MNQGDTSMQRFQDLAIGDTFDFIHDEQWRNSFFLRCTKVSARQYRYTDRGQTFTNRVGSINTEVCHVVPAEQRNAE